MTSVLYISPEGTAAELYDQYITDVTQVLDKCDDSGSFPLFTSVGGGAFIVYYLPGRLSTN